VVSEKLPLWENASRTPNPRQFQSPNASSAAGYSLRDDWNGIDIEWPICWAKVFIDSSRGFRMVGRRWPAAGMFHVASNIHVAGGRNAFSQRSLCNMQIARLAYSKSMKKCEGVVQ